MPTKAVRTAASVASMTNGRAAFQAWHLAAEGRRAPSQQEGLRCKRSAKKARRLASARPESRPQQSSPRKLRAKEPPQARKPSLSATAADMPAEAAPRPSAWRSASSSRSNCRCRSASAVAACVAALLSPGAACRISGGTPAAAREGYGSLSRALGSVATSCRGENPVPPCPSSCCHHISTFSRGPSCPGSSACRIQRSSLPKMRRASPSIFPQSCAASSVSPERRHKSATFAVSPLKADAHCTFSSASSSKSGRFCAATLHLASSAAPADASTAAGKASLINDSTVVCFPADFSCARRRAESRAIAE
mmetsp:Transcript_131708/g.421400  ORF Transcript_131708/g.421400 Transcript_131708/m.421400 type:complete len:308 (+) Transcript_131708:1146-2069(+)